MSESPKYEGWMALDGDSIKGNFKWQEYEPKPWMEDDVEIKIHYCGVCASDLHTASNGWKNANFPEVVGHEIVGEAIRVGSEVKHVKVGDIVGVGAQSDSCGKCTQCKDHREPYCDEGQTGTYAGKYSKGAAKGHKSYGGYANYSRVPGNFVVKIPDGLDPALAAPMMCGGITVYSPLVQYGAGKTAKDVGIIGIGGLGHFGLLFAKQLGANVTAISHSESKKADAEKMGATRFIATHGGGDKDFEPYKRSLDLIIATTNDEEMPLMGYLSLLRPGGNIVFVGAPEKPLPQIATFALIMNNVSLSGSAIGAPKLIAEMLDLAAKSGVKNMKAGKAKYRYVLVNEKNGGKM